MRNIFLRVDTSLRKLEKEPLKNVASRSLEWKIKKHLLDVDHEDEMSLCIWTYLNYNVSKEINDWIITL